MDLNSFRSSTFPKGKPIGNGDSIEALAVEHFFREKTPYDVTLPSIISAYRHDPAACLLFMTDDAFAFFLPAFMKIALDDYQVAGAIPEAVINRFVEMAEGRDDARRDAVLRAYSPTQLRCIADFLREMSRRYWHEYPEDSAKRALAYWGRLGEGEH